MIFFFKKMHLVITINDSFVKSTLICYHAVVYEVVFSVAAVVATSTTVLLTQAAAPGHKNVNGLKKNVRLLLGFFS